jgi:hypothetical protein
VNRCSQTLLPLVLLVPLVAASQAPDEGAYFQIPSETTVAYVGTHYWLRARLPDNWAYARSATEDGLQLVVSRDPEAGGISSDVITFTEKVAFEDWPAQHEVSWAADAYRNWEVDFMRTQGVDTGMYELRDIKMDEARIDGKTLYTMTYRQIVPNPNARDFVIHAHLHLYFPDSYAVDRRFYWIHYQHLCEQGEPEQLLLEIVNELLSSLSTDMSEAPGQSSISWSSLDGTYVALNLLGDDRTWYFSNDADRRCFSYSLEGIWATMNTPGFFTGPNGVDTVTVELVGAFELTVFPGEGLVKRIINGKRELLQLDAAGEVRVVNVEAVDKVFPGAYKATYEVPFDALGQVVTTKSDWYVADVATGWVALVQASRDISTGDDGLAQEIFESIRLTEKPGCFRDEIAELLR